ncbi:hypothetical protein H0H81_001184 [Sphagnurus paluster]|uniref:Uncharacterized protein n=1 Tax=Sphagnurus paluster TaxID=117069 RepID=A0A9P7GRL1_9AGAR|nr:hypothetical protein H0H81_001184 [Sphagnurus paluster]
MLVPLSVSSSDVHNHDDPKFSTGHLYLRQPHTVQIIQLVEGPPPPPRKITSVINASTSAYSSSYSSSSTSSEDDESLCSSYCSSDLPPEQSDSPLGDQESTALHSELPHETYSTTKRILAWRENFSAHLSTTASDITLIKTIAFAGVAGRRQRRVSRHAFLSGLRRILHDTPKPAATRRGRQSQGGVFRGRGVCL